MAPRTVEVALNGGGTRVLRGSDVVVNLGTEPLLPAIEGLAESAVQTSNTLLTLEALPESIIVLGGGYVGCEFADLLNTIGVKVTVVQRGDQLLAREDADVAAAIGEAFTEAGITLRLVSPPIISRAADGTVTVKLSSGEAVSAADILVAVGRAPVTAGVGLAEAGIHLDGAVSSRSTSICAPVPSACGRPAMRRAPRNSPTPPTTITVC